MLYYSAEINDSSLKKEIRNTEIAFAMRRGNFRNIKQSDGSVTIDISDFTAVKFLFIESSKPITATINGSAVLVDKLMFIHLASLTSLAISCDDEDGGEVSILLWGN